MISEWTVEQSVYQFRSVVWNMNGLWLSIHIGNVIIPTDFHSIIFQGLAATTNQMPLKFPLDPIKPPLNAIKPSLKLGFVSIKPPFNKPFTNPHFFLWWPSAIDLWTEDEGDYLATARREFIEEPKIFQWCRLKPRAKDDGFWHSFLYSIL